MRRKTPLCTCHRSKLADAASVLADSHKALGLAHIQEAYHAHATPSGYTASEASADSPSSVAGALFVWL